MTRANSNDDEPEVIEVIEEVLNNQMALAFLVGGAIIGAILLYAFNEYQKNTAGTVRIKLPTAPDINRYEAAPEVPQEVE